MKKTALILLLLTFFFTIQQGFCEEKKGISGFFSKLTSDKPEEDGIPKGYYGTLPNIEQDFKYKRQSAPAPTIPDARIPTEEDLKDDNLKPAPFDDSLFLDVIIKKEPTSNYVNDLQKIKFDLNNIKKSIEEQGDIQRFNACVNVFDLHVKNLKTKYGNKSDSLKESYASILSVNYYAKLLGNLMYDSNYYARYIPTQQGKYSKENIELKKQDLLNRINKTLFAIANES